MPARCSHLTGIKVSTTRTHSSHTRVRVGDTWLHLRLCLECGHVGCCDSSKNRHATRHFRQTQHPLIRSIEPGEAWVWCYVDEIVAGELRT